MESQPFQSVLAPTEAATQAPTEAATQAPTDAATHEPTTQEPSTEEQTTQEPSTQMPMTHGIATENFSSSMFTPMTTGEPVVNPVTTMTTKEPTTDKPLQQLISFLLMKEKMVTTAITRLHDLVETNEMDIAMIKDSVKVLKELFEFVIKQKSMIKNKMTIGNGCLIPPCKNRMYGRRRFEEPFGDLEEFEE